MITTEQNLTGNNPPVTVEDPARANSPGLLDVWALMRRRRGLLAFGLAVGLAAAATALTLVLPGVPSPSRLGMQFALLALPALVLGTWLGSDAAGARSRLVDLALCLIAFRAGRDLLGRAGRKWVVASVVAVGGLTALRGLYQRWVTFPEALQTLADFFRQGTPPTA